jgi:four helix bundle protein
MPGFQDLDVWTKAHDLTLEIYNITEDFPKQEQYRLVDQITRSASSVPANIAEGQARQTTKEYLQFLYNARGSLEETRYHLLLSKDLDYLSQEKYDELTKKSEEVSKMLNGLIKSLSS